jgi:hypothetical protein
MPLPDYRTNRMSVRRRTIGGAMFGVTAAALKLAATASAVGVVWIHVCGSWTPATNSAGGTVGVATSRSTPGIKTPAQCPAAQLGNGLDVITLGKTTAGKRASWQIDAAPGFFIVGAHTVGKQGMVSYGVDSGTGWGGGFYWQGGGAQVSRGETNYSSPLINSPYFGWQVVCGSSTCDGSTKPGEIAVLELEIAGAETAGPTVSVAPGSLGAAGGWARGTWTIAFSADGPSGACQLATSLGGASVSQPLNEPQSQTMWHQCSAGSFSQSFNTAAVGSASAIPLVMWARDAAYDYSARQYLSDTVTKYVNIDNNPVSGIGFAKLIDPPLCKQIAKRVRVPAHWVTVRRHHKRIRVRRPARTKLEQVTRCHARVVRRRITVWKTVTRHGKKVRLRRHKTIKVVELPHVVMHSSKRVGHGKHTTVSGWLGRPDGTALGGQPIHVLTAPDNGLGHFTVEAAATTAANGTWSVRLPVGPSRLVEASYAGAPALEPNVSAQVHVVVPAKVKLLSVSPSRVGWGATVRITGQLLGGYLPAGGALVRLRIGQGSSFQTYGVQEHGTGNGRFKTTYTFGAGYAGIYKSYWFQIAPLPIGDYPYAPARRGADPWWSVGIRGRLLPPRLVSNMRGSFER